MKNTVGLYIHIPFCKNKCSYCDFCSFQDKETDVQKYVDALINELNIIKYKVANKEVDTIFIGGGTPSYIESKYIKSIMKSVYEGFNVNKKVEITIESNPGTLDIKKVADYLSCGINRISMGLQTTNDDLLKKLGRIYSYKDFLESYELCRDMGLDNINLDLMFGIPDQSLKDWDNTLDNVIKLQPSHISCYSLKIEENTKFFDIQDSLNLPCEEIERGMYYTAKSKLGNNGYEQYEISNFSLKGKESRHNMKYWQLKEYVGVGLSAYSYFDGVRYHNTYDLKEYIDSLVSNPSNYQIIDSLNTEKDNMSEFMFMGLRMNRGISKQKFKDTFGLDVNEEYGSVIEKFKNEKLLVEDKDRIYLTDKGFDVSNIVMSEFV